MTFFRRKKKLPLPSELLTYNPEHSVYETDFPDTIPTDHAPLEGEKRSHSRAWFKVSLIIALALTLLSSVAVLIAFHLKDVT